MQDSVRRPSDTVQFWDIEWLSLVACECRRGCKKCQEGVQARNCKVQKPQRRESQPLHCTATSESAAQKQSCQTINCYSSSSPRWLFYQLPIPPQFLLSASGIWFLFDSSLVENIPKLECFVVPLYPRLRHIGLPECVVKCQYFMILLPISSSLLNLFRRWW